MTSFNSQFYRSGCVLSWGDDELRLGWGESESFSSPKESSDKSAWLYAPDFFLKEKKPWISFPYGKTVRLGQVSDLYSEIARVTPVESSWREPDFSIFQNTFSKIQSEILQGTIQKAVPVAFETSPLRMTPDLLETLLTTLIGNIRQHSLSLSVFGYWNEKEGILGATPEILFRKRSQGPAETMALAGTRKKGSDSLPLLDDPKELMEHRLVIQGIQEALKGFSEVSVGETQELSLPTLSHLLTPIFFSSLERGDDFFEKSVKRLHPTPALGTFPRSKGLDWLEKLPSEVDRHRFGAPFGMVSESGEMECVVSIRNLQWNSEGLFLGAGCGIVAASRLEKEWNEIQAKLQSVKLLFGLTGKGQD